MPMTRVRPARKALSLLCVALLLCAVVSVAHAQAQATPNGAVFDTVRNQFQTAIGAWGTNISAAASRLFWTLAIISMVWTFGMMALRKAEFQEVIMELLRFSITLGFFLYLLTNGNTFALSIFNGLAQLGAAAGGLPTAATPSGIMSQGWQLWEMAIKSTSFTTHPVDSVVMLLTAVVVIVVFALIAVNYLLLSITAWLVAYAGIFVLGFGGSRWTSEIALQYFKTVLNIALQVMTMILLVAVGYNFMQTQVGTIPANGMSPTDMAVMLVCAIILLELSNRIPPLVGGMVGGSSGGIGQHGAGTALTVGAASMAAVSMAGSMAMSTVRGAAGGASAIMSAYKAAGDGGGGKGGGSGGSALAGGIGGDEAGAGAGSLSEAMGGPSGSGQGGSPLATTVAQGADGEGSGVSESNGGGLPAEANAGASGPHQPAPGGDTAAAEANADETAAAANADELAASDNSGEGTPPASATGPAAPTAGGLAGRLGRTAAILASGTAATAVAAAKRSIREKSIGGKIAATIDAHAANRGKPPLSADALKEVTEFATPQTPETPKASET